MAVTAVQAVLDPGRRVVALLEVGVHLVPRPLAGSVGAHHDDQRDEYGGDHGKHLEGRGAGESVEQRMPERRISRGFADGPSQHDVVDDDLYRPRHDRDRYGTGQELEHGLGEVTPKEMPDEEHSPRDDLQRLGECEVRLGVDQAGALV